MYYSRYFADVSAYQPNVNMREYADAGHLLIAIKASEGLSYVNPYHRGQALAAGLEHVAVVHYHFARPDLGTQPDAEADHFLGVCGSLLGPYDYVVVDVERATPQGWQHDPAWSRAFDQRVRNFSRFKCIIYASRSVLQASDQWLAGAPLRVWDAAYSTEPDYAPQGYTVAFRQYTDGVVGPEPHSFAGVGQCDGNYANYDIIRHLLAYRS